MHVCVQCDDGSAAAAAGKGARHPRYEVLSVESLTELERKKSSMMLMGLQLSSKSNSSQEIQTPQEADVVDADDSGKTQLSVNYCQFLLYWPTSLDSNFGKNPASYKLLLVLLYVPTTLELLQVGLDFSKVSHWRMLGDCFNRILCTRYSCC